MRNFVYRVLSGFCSCLFLLWNCSSCDSQKDLMAFTCLPSSFWVCLKKKKNLTKKASADKWNIHAYLLLGSPKHMMMCSFVSTDEQFQLQNICILSRQLFLRKGNSVSYFGTYSKLWNLLSFTNSCMSLSTVLRGMGGFYLWKLSLLVWFIWIKFRASTQWCPNFTVMFKGFHTLVLYNCPSEYDPFYFVCGTGYCYIDQNRG